MKKIVFATIPMQEIEGEGWDPDGYFYKFDENKSCEYSGKTHFAVNGFLAKTLKKNDDVKVVRILVNAEKSAKNAEIQKTELKGLNKTIGAKIDYEEIVTEFTESGRTVEDRFRKIIGSFEDDCDIVLDITYGSKTLIPVLFYALSFAEKFFNANIENILYDKTEFKKLPSGKTVPDADKCELYDITSLYYLNSLTSVMSAPDSKTALERLDKFFAI